MQHMWVEMYHLTKHFFLCVCDNWPWMSGNSIAAVINNKTWQSMDFSIKDGCFLSSELNRCAYCFVVVDLLGEIGM